MSRKAKYPEFALWLVVLFWGANYVIGKWGMAGFNPITFNALRFLGATPIMFCVLYIMERDLRIEVRDCLELAGIGLIGISLYQCLFMSTIKYASATNASLLLATSPVFTAIFASLAGQEKLGKFGKGGSVLALFGVILVILFGTNKLASGWSVWRGDILGVLSSAVWGLYPVISQRMLHKYSALKTTTYSTLFGAIILLLIGFPFILRSNWSTVPISAWGSLFFSLGPVTAYSMLVWYYFISRMGSNRIMAYMYAVPIVAVLTAALVLGERMHVMQFIGAAVIFLGIYLIRRDKAPVIKTHPQNQPTSKLV